MEIRKTITHTDGTQREYIFFKVKYNHFRDVSDSTEHAIRDAEEWAEWNAQEAQLNTEKEQLAAAQAEIDSGRIPKKWCG